MHLHRRSISHRRRSRRAGRLHVYGLPTPAVRRLAWSKRIDALVPRPSAALKALCTHELVLTAAQEESTPRGTAQQLVFLAAYHLLAAAAGTAAAWQPLPSERAVRRGSCAIRLGSEERDVALGFIKLLTATGWERFSLSTMLDWDSRVRSAFLKACSTRC